MAIKHWRLGGFLALSSPCGFFPSLPEIIFIQEAGCNDHNRPKCSATCGGEVMLATAWEAETLAQGMDIAGNVASSRVWLHI